MRRVIQQFPAVPIFLVTLLLVACSDSSTGLADRYDDLSGSYSGDLVGLAQGVILEATMSFTLSQTRGDLSGTWSLSGLLDDGWDLYTVQGTGTITGTVGRGNNPSVNLVVRSATCPNYSATLSGAYDSSNRRLTLTGPVDILNTDCSIALRYQTTFIVDR